jgi:hypothetical protein
MDFVVKRDDLHTCRVVDGEIGDLEPDQVQLAIDSFGLTTNNITYAVFGEAMAYWAFFPAEEGWGRVPVWGFATVEAGHATELEEGRRIFGYLPPSSHLAVTPSAVDARGFSPPGLSGSLFEARSIAREGSSMPHRIARTCRPCTTAMRSSTP